jgi:hypothetical protein
MSELSTYVGIDARKKDLFIAMLISREKTAVSWQLANDPQTVRRLVADAGAARGRARVLRDRAVWLRIAATDDDGAGELRRGRAGGVDSPEA